MSEDISIPRSLLRKIESLLESYTIDLVSLRDWSERDTPFAHEYVSRGKEVAAVIEEINEYTL